LTRLHGTETWIYFNIFEKKNLGGSDGSKQAAKGVTCCGPRARDERPRANHVRPVKFN